MKVLVTGSTGFIGSALVSYLREKGHEVCRLARKSLVEGEMHVFWNPASGEINPEDLEGFDAVIHLAGDGIAQGRWTAAKKRRILESRVQGTELLSKTLAGLKAKPKVFISASAVGFYGDRGDEVLNEGSPVGKGYLAEVCQAWEKSADAARQAGIRVVHPRFGLILAKHGGALKPLLLPFGLGLGGVIGSGKQWWSWITLDDVIRGLEFLLSNKVEGPVNFTAPKPATNREFVGTLGRVLGRPTIFPLPAFMARLMLGEMAQELILSGQRVEPRKLLAGGFRFHADELELGLRAALGRDRRSS